MKISTTPLSHKKLIAVVIAVVLLCVGVVAALEATRVTDFMKSNSSDTSGPTEAEKSEQTKTELDEKQDLIESPDPTTQPPSPETNAVIDLSARQESNGSVTVLTKLYSIDDGSCTLTVTNGSATHTQTAEVIYQPDFSSCAGFNIPKEKLGAGDWAIKLSVTSDTTLEKTIAFKVN